MPRNIWLWSLRLFALNGEPGGFLFWERATMSGAQSEITIACIQMEPVVGAKQANLANSLKAD